MTTPGSPSAQNFKATPTATGNEAAKLLIMETIPRSGSPTCRPLSLPLVLLLALPMY
ncbi:MAG: hypothetical protein Q9O62_07485 [Ardenticatenia bacterium]|nr:hypothetical protein [Ardenticatenia bacterium]